MATEVDLEKEEPNGVILFPATFQRIERIEENGTEIPEHEYTTEELFKRSVHELEQEYRTKKAKLQAHSNDDDCSWMDPRIHYRPMVAALQASHAELQQLLFLIDTIRGKQYLEETYCIREDTLPKVMDFQLLLETKATQMKEAANILTRGVQNLQNAVEKERYFFRSMLTLIKQWKLCAPLHGSIPKPIRAGEGLAIDCSYTSAGSMFEPQKVSLGQLAYAMLRRTEKGFALVTLPEEHLPRTLQAVIECTNKAESYKAVLPGYELPELLTKEQLDQLGNSDEDQKQLEEYNNRLLRSIQHSVFCEEIFQTIMKESLRSESNWIDTVRCLSTSSKKNSYEAGITVMHVVDDEVKIRLSATHVLSIQLIETTKLTSVPTPNCPRLKELCHATLYLLQMEMQQYHQKYQNGTRFQLFAAEQQNTSTTNSYQPPESNILSPVIFSIAHDLLKSEIHQFLHDISQELAMGDVNSSFFPRLFSGPVCSPYCDTIEGIYCKPQWKHSNRRGYSVLNLSIGKFFTTEVVIDGTEIRFAGNSISNWGPLASDGQAFGTLEEFQQYFIYLIQVQIAELIFRETRALGVQRVTIDVDHTTVRVFSAGEWDGSVIGDRKVSDKNQAGCINLKAVYLSDGTFTIACTTQYLGIIPELDGINAMNVDTEAVNSTNSTSNYAFLKWKDIPGLNDMCKMEWLYQRVGIIPTI